MNYICSSLAKGSSLILFPCLPCLLPPHPFVPVRILAPEFVSTHEFNKVLATSSQGVSEAMFEGFSKYASEGVFDSVSEDVFQGMSKGVVKGVSECVFDSVSEDVSKGMSKDASGVYLRVYLKVYPRVYPRVCLRVSLRISLGCV